MGHPRLPLAPLLEAAAGPLTESRLRLEHLHGGKSVGRNAVAAEFFGVSVRTACRWMAWGHLPLPAAEKAAERIMWHPSNVWGQNYWEKTKMKQEADLVWKPETNKTGTAVR